MSLFDSIDHGIEQRNACRETHDLDYEHGEGQCRRCGRGPHVAGKYECPLTERQAAFLDKMWSLWETTGDERFRKAFLRGVRDIEIPECEEE